MVRDVFFKKTFVGFMALSVCMAFIVACASTKPGEVSASEGPREPYTNEQEGAAISETTAEKMDAHSFVEIKFPQNSSKLTAESKDSIRNLIKGLREMKFDDTNFRTSSLIRLRVLQDHLEKQRLTEDLLWQRSTGKVARA